MTMDRFDPAPVLAGLKDFQQATVDYVFDRMYGTKPTTRFLVADEVGLGKTLVARGLIARAIDHHLQNGARRIDIVYICSNADIAKQNLRRLNVTQRREFAFEQRLTMLAAHLHRLTKQRLNFIAFTPGTSFDLKGSLGMAPERAHLWWLLQAMWGSDRFRGDRQGVVRIFQGGVSTVERMRAVIRSHEITIDAKVMRAFRASVRDSDRAAKQAKQPTFFERFENLARRWRYDRKHRPREDHDDRNRFIGELRALLARACIQALQPRLVILDEFQRFKRILDGDDDAATLAHELFDYAEGEGTGARTLLLSATPYKMYTVSDEQDEDDHYADFLRTVDFLMKGDSARFKQDLTAFRRALLAMGATGSADGAVVAKDRVQAHLRTVMCRTERLAIARQRDGMVTEVPPRGLDLRPEDARAYVSLQRVADELEAGEHIEYWKSTPYFLNFVDGYQMGERLRRAQEDPEQWARIREAANSGEGLIDWDAYRTFDPIDPGNPRMRSLHARALDDGRWKLLWVPPSLPYHEPGHPFDMPAAATLTKQLVFSAWNAVPRAIATLTSYGAEHQMMKTSKRPNTPEERAKIPELLRFTAGRRLAGMPVLALIYPSVTLAEIGDPLRHVADAGTGGAPLPLKELRGRVRAEIEAALAPYATEREGRADEAWYWAVPFLLDQAGGHGGWLFEADPVRSWVGPESSRGDTGLQQHLERARDLVRGDVDLGPMPEDLLDVLTDLAIAGPATCAFRALRRLTDPEPTAEVAESIRSGAARIGFEFRNLFNLPSVQYFVQSLYKEGRRPYWRKALRYCLHGNLQAVLDEFSHVLREWMGLLDLSVPAAWTELSEELAGVVSLRAVDYELRDPFDEWESGKRRIRIRFAAPFGQHRLEQVSQARRAATVRTAFNSPFWPFVLASTSIGQEGLDFHQYCHSLVHWNLPGNPVDLEQREGRVHRYKGHAIRKNVAAAHAEMAFRLSVQDPWKAMFKAAQAARPSGENDLVPFWLYPGDAMIERHVPALPLSREVPRLEGLKQSLALYRLVFGQARQDDLVEFLARRGVEGSAAAELSARLRVDLTPSE